MGGQLSLVTPSAATVGIDAYVSELEDIQYEGALGNARFLKAVKGQHADGMVVIKVFIKPLEGLDVESLSKELKGGQGEAE
jgi:phosphoinositide-3-kinase regulatory subunit 4